MSTTLFLRDVPPPGLVAPNVPRLLSPTRGALAVRTFTNTVDGPVTLAPPPVTLVAAGPPVRWYSNPATVAFSIVQTPTIHIRAHEDNKAANAALGLRLWRVAADGTEIAAFAFSANFGSPEMTTKDDLVWISFYANGLPCSGDAGDRIALDLYLLDGQGAGAMESAHQVQVSYDGHTVDGWGDSWIRFDEDLPFA
jgi:hypothetical protein